LNPIRRKADAREHQSADRTRRLKQLYRYAMVRAVRDQRHRRFALNHIFSTYVTADTLCLARFDDHEIFIDPRDDKIAFTILSGRPWQRSQFNRALSAVQRAGRMRSDGLFVDVGANIGAITLYALLSGHFRHVLALEPDPYNRAILERNIAHNGFTDRVTIIPAAASNAMGTMAFYRDDKNFGAHSLEEGFSHGQGKRQDVPVSRLDGIVQDAGYALDTVGFVKIDVEGHEHAVLDGMPGLLASQPPLMLEVTYQRQSGVRHDEAVFHDPDATLSRLPASYADCLPLDEDMPASVAPLAFLPYKAQHDLLIF